MFESVYGITTYIQDNNNINDILSKLEEFVLPYKYGRIVEQYIPVEHSLNVEHLTLNSPKIVLIQDLHCHPEVQKKHI